MSDAIRPRLTSRDIFRGPFWLLDHRLVTFTRLIPAWMVAHEAQANYQDPTGPFIMTLLMLVTLNLLCRGISNRLGRARLNFSGQVTAPPTATAQAAPQPAPGGVLPAARGKGDAEVGANRRDSGK